MTAERQLWDAARDLYATALPDFVKARNALARELKDTGDAAAAQRVAAFKKPSTAAHLVNRLVRDGGDLPEQIVDLGARLREAQVDADAATLRALDQERRQLLARVVEWVRADAQRSGGGTTDAVLRDVEQTVWAAVVDAWAGATVQAGMLVRAMSPGGFGQADVAGASALDVDEPPEPERPVARPARKRPPRPKATPRRPDAAEARARREAERALEDAQAAAGQAQRRLEEAARATEAADARRADLDDERERLRAELSATDRRLREAQQEITAGRAALRAAEKQRRAAAAEVDRALRALERTGPDPADPGRE